MPEEVNRCSRQGWLVSQGADPKNSPEGNVRPKCLDHLGLSFKNTLNTYRRLFYGMTKEALVNNSKTFFFFFFPEQHFHKQQEKNKNSLKAWNSTCAFFSVELAVSRKFVRNAEFLSLPQAY